MAATEKPALETLLGRSPDQLSLEEHRALVGSWIALELYGVKTTPLRRIEAIGDRVQDCILMLRNRGLDPRNFEFSPLRPPY